MKTSIRILAYIALSIIAMLGICGLFGEPTPEYWAWMHRTFGAFAFVWFFFEKAFWGLLLTGVYHVYSLLNADTRQMKEGEA